MTRAPRALRTLLTLAAFACALVPADVTSWAAPLPSPPQSTTHDLRWQLDEPPADPLAVISAERATQGVVAPRFATSGVLPTPPAVPSSRGLHRIRVHAPPAPLPLALDSTAPRGPPTTPLLQG